MVTRTEKACCLTPEDFKEILKYDPDTGHFFWLIDVRVGANKRLFRKAGDLAGGLTETGYVIISVKYHRLYAHRLAWYMTHGEWPHEKLDHRNLKRADNRMANLRPATGLENRSNTASRAKSGFKGVVRPKHARNTFVGQITISGKNHYLGAFSTAEKAHAAYCEAATKAFGEFARFN